MLCWHPGILGNIHMPLQPIGCISQHIGSSSQMTKALAKHCYFSLEIMVRSGLQPTQERSLLLNFRNVNLEIMFLERAATTLKHDHSKYDHSTVPHFPQQSYGSNPDLLTNLAPPAKATLHALLRCCRQQNPHYAMVHAGDPCGQFTKCAKHSAYLRNISL